MIGLPQRMGPTLLYGQLIKDIQARYSMPAQKLPTKELNVSDNLGAVSIETALYVSEMASDTYDQNNDGKTIINFLTVEASSSAKQLPRALQAGMTVQADIVTDRRRVIDFFLSPLTKYMQEGITVR